jgi:hypothetical protein
VSQEILFWGITSRYPSASKSNWLQCWHLSGFLYWIGVYSVNSSEMMGNFPEVLTFNRLFLNSTGWFVTSSQFSTFIGTDMWIDACREGVEKTIFRCLRNGRQVVMCTRKCRRPVTFFKRTSPLHLCNQGFTLHSRATESKHSLIHLFGMEGRSIGANETGGIIIKLAVVRDKQRIAAWSEKRQTLTLLQSCQCAFLFLFIAFSCGKQLIVASSESRHYLCHIYHVHSHEFGSDK